MDMIQIQKDDLLESLRIGYLEVKECIENGNDKVDLGHVKGFCVTIEQILANYAGVTEEEMMAIKEPIIGSLSLTRKGSTSAPIETDADLEQPSIFRRQKV